jgi:hypothetical protein
MKDRKKQRVCVIFCFKLVKICAETFQTLQQAYGEECFCRMLCHEWYQRFKSGRTSVEKNPKSGKPSTSNDNDHVEKVLAMIHQNHRLTVREVAKEVGIRKRSCHLILTNQTQVHHVATKFVPRLVADALLIRQFLTKHEMTLSPGLPTLQIWPCKLFLVLEVEILTKSSPISEGRFHRRKFIKDLCPISQNTFQDVFQIWKNVGSSVSRVEGSTLEETGLIKL